MAPVTLTPKEKMAAAGGTLVCAHEFFATVWLTLKKIECEMLLGPDGSGMFIDTMATDGRHVFYNPHFVDAIDDRQLVGVCAHEVLHVVGLHPYRQMHREIERWNIATDAVINGILKKAHMALPPGVVEPVDGMSAEEVYEKLDSMPQSRFLQGNGNGKGGGRGPRRWGPGMGVGGVIEPRDAQGRPLHGAELAKHMQGAQDAVTRAVARAKAAGQIPAGLEQFIEEAKETRTPWKKLLSEFIGGFTRDDYSWMYPNLRHLQRDLVLPTLKVPGIGLGVIACDLSGSMNGIVQMVTDEVQGFLQQYEQRGDSPEVLVLWFDADVYPQLVTEPAELKPQGGGGTRYSPVFDYVATKAPEVPAFIVVLTDGECNDFGEQPAMPVLWILTSHNARFDPPFGQVCCVLDDEQPLPHAA